MSNAKRRHRSRRRRQLVRARFGIAPGDWCDTDHGFLSIVTRVEEDWGPGYTTVYYGALDGLRSHFHTTVQGARKARMG